MYDLAAYGQMIADDVRRGAYAAALEHAVRPGSTVLEIGTGPGVFALLAARLGARRVYAVDPDDTIEIGRRLAEANDLGDAVRFIRGLSTEIELPERVDVVVSDLRNILPLFKAHLPSIVDARERLLAPGGVLVPREDRLWAAVVSAEEIHARRRRGWEAGHEMGLDLSVPLELLSHTLSKVRVEASQCLTEPHDWAVLDYPSVRDSDARGEASWSIARPGTAHGLAVWFDTVLHGEIGFSNAPGAPELLYGQTFFPWPRPVRLGEGDRVRVELAASLIGDDYVWQWTTAIDSAGPPVRFEQSTFHAAPLSAGRLRKRQAGYVPELGDDGRVARFVLERMDGHASLEAIARELQAAFPGRFDDWRAALTLAGELAERYG